MSNPFLKREQNRRYKAGLRAERKVIKEELGGRVHPGSGAIPGLKSDGTVAEFRVESKSTKHASISIKRDWLKKISREALSAGQVPMLTISFTDDAGNVKETWAAIPLWKLQEML